ncbi:MAG TPA: hypothetical protein VMF08_00840 [Candidatus Sulfotelmatobacter sp.]|nr:hypothetical protein [Candidatus Sulfotelmatobacter sp.]
MKTAPHPLLVHFVRHIWAAITVTSAILSAVLLGGVPVQAATTSDWTAVSSDDWSVSGDWTPSGVPDSLTTYAVITNSFPCNYNTGDTNSVGGLFIGTNLLGTLSMSGGTLNVSNAAAQYIVTLGGGVPGASSLTGNVGGPGVANMVINGGSLNVARDTGGFQQDGFVMGLDTGSSGTLGLGGGTANFWCGMEMGCEGDATLDVSGGVLVDTGWFHVGEGINSGTTDGNGSATFNLSGGAVYILPNSSGGIGGITGGFTCGYDVTNTVANISGGSIYSCEITMSDSGGIATNALNIVGGSIYVGFEGVQSNSTAGFNGVNQVNISGGTFHTADMLIYGSGGVLGSTNNVLSDGTNWTWMATLPVNLTNNTFTVTNGAGSPMTGPGYVTFAPEANRTITLDNQWSGTGGFQVSGPGTVISANNGLQNVAGGVTINGGTLVINGSITNTSGSGLFVQAGGTLSLSTNTAVTGIGSLTTSNVTINGTLNFKLNTATTTGAGVNDLLVVTNLTLDAGSVLNVIPLSMPALGSTYVVAQYGTLTTFGTPTGSFGTVTDSVNDTFSVSVQNNEILLTVTALGAGNFNWIAPSPADWSVAGDWDLQSVPAFPTANVLLTNGVTCDYSTGDTNTVGTMVLGPLTDSTGTFLMSGGSLTLTNPANGYALNVGGWGGASDSSLTAQTAGNNSAGNFTMNGGTLTVTRQGSGFYHQDSFMIGMGTNATGTFTLNSGTANILCGLEIGCHGAGTLDVNGGVLADNGWFHVGEGTGFPGASGSGIFNLTGGAVYILPNKGGITYASQNGGLAINQGVTNATANISGGSIYTYGIGLDYVTNATPTTGSTATLNISGGLIYVGNGGVFSNAYEPPSGESQIQTVNISGGTFHTADILFSGGGPGVNGSTNNVLSDGTNWVWQPNPWVNLTTSPGPGVVTFAPEAGRTITLENVWSGPGSMNFAGPGTVVTTGAITNSSVTISGGTYVDESAHFSVPLIVIGGGATFNVSAAGSVTLSPTLTVSNSSSTAILVGTINSGTATANLTYASGTPAWSINGTLTLSSGTTLSIDNTGSPLAPGNYLIVSTNTATSMVTGTIPTAFAVGGAGIAPGTAASLSINGGQLYLVVTPLPQPVFTSISVNGSTLNLAATNFVSGGVVNSTFVLLENTNLLTPVSQWTPVLTNTFNVSGLLNLSTNVVQPAVPQEFYILEY